MSRGERKLFIVVLAVLLLALALLLGQTSRGGDAPKVYRIAVLLDGSDPEYWKNFISGVNQAALEHNADVRLITRYDGPAAQGQADTLRGEWDGEADGIVVVPAGTTELAAALDEAPSGITITVAGPAPETERQVCCVAPDYYALGGRLADAVADGGASFCTVYPPEGESPAATQILSGVTAQLDERAVSYTIGTLPDGEPIPPAAGALAAVDPATAEALCRLVGTEGRVYGVGTSNRLLHYLEDGAAGALAVQSDYDAGYFSLTRTVEAMSGVYPGDVLLQSYTVEQETMFESPFAEFLFPTS